MTVERKAGEGSDGRKKIDVSYERIDSPARVPPITPVEDQRNVNLFLIEMLAVPAMSVAAQALAVIGGNDPQRAIEVTFAF